MQELIERYLANVARCAVLNRPTFEPGLSDSELLEGIQRNAQEVHELILQNNEILDQFLLGRNPAEITDEDIRDLSTFADRLFLYNHSIDDGTAYRIHRLLLDVATLRGDRDMRIRELYYVGITLQYMKISCNDLNLFALLGEVRAAFDAAAEYMAVYEEIESEQTRSFIVRSLANRKLGLERTNKSWDEYDKLFTEAMDVITSPKYRAMNPNLPWDAFEYSMHADRAGLTDAMRFSDDPLRAQQVLASARYIYEHTEEHERNNNRFTSSRVSYLYAAARYHAGEITLHALLSMLFELYEHADWSDYSDKGLVFNVNVPCYIQYYTGRLPREERAMWRTKRREVFSKVSEYLARMNASEYMFLLNNNVQEIVALRAQGDRSFREHKLEYILSCHRPTYVHSHVVAWLAGQLAWRMTEVSPSALIGVLGVKNEDGVRARAQEIAQHVYECALYHDMGKNMLLSAVSLYHRRLIDLEFGNIKWHPIFGARLLRMCGAGKDAQQVALYHHLFYDGTGGYPQDCEPCSASARPLVGIVSVADSLDAGTDNIGRCYAAVKTFETLVGELRAGSGTRYDPAVVALFDDESFIARMRDGLTATRREIYCHAYRSSEEAAGADGVL
ncbi:MAG: HD domain-containing protein [Christensenellaceae bacterium]|nr:HD domain-containing protein [Christensenellaceae bacterium]